MCGRELFFSAKRSLGRRGWVFQGLLFCVLIFVLFMGMYTAGIVGGYSPLWAHCLIVLPNG